jgi:hypothetical protein
VAAAAVGGHGDRVKIRGLGTPSMPTFRLNNCLSSVSGIGHPTQKTHPRNYARICATVNKNHGSMKLFICRRKFNRFFSITFMKIPHVATAFFCSFSFDRKLRNEANTGVFIFSLSVR